MSPSPFFSQTYLSLGGGGGCDGTHLLPQGHSRVYGRVDIGTCARYRSCLCHIVRLAGNLVYEYSAAEHMTRDVIVCRWERMYIMYCKHQ